MNFVSERDFPNLEIIPHTFNSCFFSAQLYPTDKTMEVSLSPLEGFSDHDWTQQLPYSSKQLCLNEFPDLENLDIDFSLPPLGEDLEEVDQKPLNIIVVPEDGLCSREKGFGDALLAIESGSAICVKKEEVQNIEQMLVPRASGSSSSKKKKPCALEFEDIKKHFDVPINEAAKQMNVGLTMLKRRCRELNIMRWPHRKLKSLQLLIDNVKELGLTEEVSMLEKHKRLLEKLPGLEISAKAKKLRQACFKANYKRRRYMGMAVQA